MDLPDLRGVCRTLGGVGAACGSFMDCEGELDCLRGGRCGLRVDLDEPCVEQRDCVFGLICAQGRCVLPRCR
ncbi:MAG: hypothetical protein ACOZQL_18905 [Myxococcota bacterium]